MSGRRNLSDCACCAPGADAICARGAKAGKGLVPGMLQNFALPFRHRQQAPHPLRPPVGRQVELRLDQPAAIGGPDPGMLQNLALTSRHHPHAVQPLRPPAGAQVEHRWSQRAISEGRHLGCCVCCAPGADAVCASAADAVKGLVPGMLQDFALPFRLRSPAGWQVEARWD